MTILGLHLRCALPHANKVKVTVDNLGGYSTQALAPNHLDLLLLHGNASNIIIFRAGISADHIAQKAELPFPACVSW